MTIVQCHGCFDLLHVGHIRHFQAAKQAGDRLIVTVTSDRFVNKGPDRPVFNQALRMEAIQALGCVDEVRLSDAPTAAEAIRMIRPSIFAKGPDYSAQSLDAGELAAIQDVGGRLLITNTEKWSSTALLQIRPDVSPEIRAYLDSLKVTAGDVFPWLEEARTKQVLVVGDAITDVYEYCTVAGKAGKEPILVGELTGKVEQFVGGTEAVARHARAMSDRVLCLTGPMITKRRFVETYPFRKVFETYQMDEVVAANDGDALASRLPYGEIDEVVIVADYGHGFMTPALVARLTDGAKFFAVNVQANAGNHGFNTISKYPRADFISISERELRLDARDQTTDVRALMRCAADARHCTLLVTRGAHGCLVYRRGVFAEAPALASHAIDSMGAGDAVFGVTAACASVGMPLDLLAFMAAVAGTMAVGIVGNQTCIERSALRQEIERWLR